MRILNIVLFHLRILFNKNKFTYGLLLFEFAFLFMLIHVMASN
jgi:hypothetical protein